ncbi:MAG TPA: phosphotransferase [Steroidobacteraceae bacterium]|nr:phosphotransferase [Steroidobacteraceae bacterium]
MSDPRLDTLNLWLAEDLGMSVQNIAPASADASFRRYFRAWNAAGETFVVMDAPPDKEDLSAYLRVSGLLEQCGVHVPHVHARDLTRGYALLEDLGARHMLTALNEGGDAASLYADALDTLAGLQLAGDGASRQLPPYDRSVLLREMQLLPEWYCQRHLALELDAWQRSLMQDTFEWLAAQALEQPQVFVHRDYHSRNLMITSQRSPGVIDFQDALRGPVGYDLASILKDCYVDWPRAQVVKWVEQYRDRLRDASGGRALIGASSAQFLRWFDLIGLQRHLKVLGIFARLFWRDGKSGYLADLPRTLHYVRETVALYPELTAFRRFVEECLTPGLAAANQRALATTNT